MEFDNHSSRVIGSAIEVHRHLGPGLLELASEHFLADELSRGGIAFQLQHPLIPSCSSCPSWSNEGPLLQPRSLRRRNSRGEHGVQSPPCLTSIVVEEKGGWLRRSKIV